MRGEVAGGLLVVDKVVDGGMCAAELTVVAALHMHGAEVHGLGIERQQTVGEQLAHAGDILQRLGRLNGAKHSGDGTEHASLRTGGHGPYGWRLLGLLIE